MPESAGNFTPDKPGGIDGDIFGRIRRTDDLQGCERIETETEQDQEPGFSTGGAGGQVAPQKMRSRLKIFSPDSHRGDRAGQLIYIHLFARTRKGAAEPVRRRTGSLVVGNIDRRRLGKIKGDIVQSGIPLGIIGGLDMQIVPERCGNPGQHIVAIRIALVPVLQVGQYELFRVVDRNRRLAHGGKAVDLGPRTGALTVFRPHAPVVFALIIQAVDIHPRFTLVVAVKIQRAEIGIVIHLDPVSRGACAGLPGEPDLGPHTGLAIHRIEQQWLPAATARYGNIVGLVKGSV